MWSKIEFLFRSTSSDFGYHEMDDDGDMDECDGLAMQKREVEKERKHSKQLTIIMGATEVGAE